MTVSGVDRAYWVGEASIGSEYGDAAVDEAEGDSDASDLDSA